MRIALDARFLSEDITGIPRYSVESLKHMSQMGHTWFLYSHRPIPLLDWFGSNITTRWINLDFRGLWLLWYQTMLPYWALQDEVDLFWSPSHRIPALLSRKIARVATIHDLVWRRAGSTMQPVHHMLDKILAPKSIQLSDRVIAVSQSTANDLVEEFPLEQEKVRIIHEGVTTFDDTSAHVDRLVEEVSGFRPYFLFVGTLEPRKNLDRLIAAYALLPSNIRDRTNLVIAGKKGWGGVDPALLAEKYGITDRVKVLGYVPDLQLSLLYSNALFLAMPSLYEGFGLTLLEAMSKGIPILTSNLSSMPEVVGDAGVFVDPHDISSIASGLKTLLSDESLRANLRVRAKNRIAKFSWKASARNTLNIFEQAVDVRRHKLCRKST